jgi:heat shock protein HslJ
MNRSQSVFARWDVIGIGSLLCLLAAACTKQPADRQDSIPASSQPVAVPSSSPVSTGTVADMGGPEWRLESFADGEPVPTDIHITLALNGERISGRGGCNRYMGTVKDGDAPGRISVGPLALTKMACAPAAEAAEVRFTGSLQRATSFAIRDGKFLISYPDGGQVRTLILTRG